MTVGTSGGICAHLDLSLGAATAGEYSIEAFLTRDASGTVFDVAQATILLGTGGVAVTFDAGTVINALGAVNFQFDSNFANSVVLQGTLNLAAAAKSYTVNVVNTAGTVQFAAGSAVTIGTCLAATAERDETEFLGPLVDLGQILVRRTEHAQEPSKSLQWADL